ncbi:MAG: ATP-dependent helicase, partial [Eubacterium sp.]|nr:ATP-dependent helicase [Eubacterium sp.]
ENVSAECRDIIGGILFYNGKGISYEDMAVIFRTNTQPRLLVGRLMEYNIPFRMRDLIPNIFDHWIAKNVISYLKLAGGERDRALFLSVMNRPKRYISRSLLSENPVDFVKLKSRCSGKRWLLEKIDQMETDLIHMGRKNPYDAITYLRSSVGYEEYLEEYAGFRRMNPEDLKEVMDQIQETAKGYDTFEEWFRSIEEYGQELKKQMEAGTKKDLKGLTLTTMHSSKGLEYEIVFIIDSNEGICPHRKAVKEADLEEERRLYYVAMTRARTYLFLYSVRELYQKKSIPSRYINEIRYDPDLYTDGREEDEKIFPGLPDVT